MVRPNWTWSCHACGAVRPNEDIEVVFRRRYCRDNPECLRIAQAMVRDDSERLGKYFR